MKYFTETDNGIPEYHGYPLTEAIGVLYVYIIRIRNRLPFV